MAIWWFPVITPIISLAITGYSLYWIIKQEDIPEDKRELPRIIQRGAIVFGSIISLRISILTLMLAALIFKFYGVGASLSCVLGSALGVAVEFLGIFTAVKANSRVVEAANEKPAKAFGIAVRAGSILGQSVVALTLLGITIVFETIGYAHTTTLASFSFGFSLFSLLGRVGGGFFAKAADIGSDLVGKYEMNIREDDPRNPGSGGDPLGDIVSDSAAGIDIGDTFAAAIASALILTMAKLPVALHRLPLLIASLGIWSSMIGTHLTLFLGTLPFLRKMATPRRLVNITYVFSTSLFIGLAYLFVCAGQLPLGLFLPTISGSLVILVITFTNLALTSDEGEAVKKLVEDSKDGASFNISGGLAIFFNSPVFPLIGVTSAMIVAWFAPNILNHYSPICGVAFAALGMLSISAVTVTNDALGAISDNASAICRVAGFPESVRTACSGLDSLGNTMKAFTRQFAATCSTLTIVTLVFSFAEEAGISSFDIMSKPVTMVGGFIIGALIPLQFSSVIMSAAVKNARLFALEIRRQFVELKLLENPQAKPDYDRCISLNTTESLKPLWKLAVIAIGSPLVIGFVLGKYFLLASLVGVMLLSSIIAIGAATMGGALDNAKKLVEDSGREGTELHRIAVIGDLVGDILKDIIGTSLETLATLLSITALIAAKLVAKRSLFNL